MDNTIKETPKKLPKRKGAKLHSLNQRHNLIGWIFLTPAALLICYTSFYPMIQALVQSFKTGKGMNMKWTWEAPTTDGNIFYNFTRMFEDDVFLKAMGNNFIFLAIQVPIMLLAAIMFASMLNNKDLKCKGLFRTLIFLPCATSLVSCSIVFRAMFDYNGIINTLLVKTGILETPYEFLAHTWSARLIIILVLLWRWTGYNMVFFLSGLQTIEYSTYEAARIDGANKWQIFWRITVPQLKPIILLTAIMSTNGTLQLFDEVWNITAGGPANGTMSMSVYIYNTAFRHVPNFGYVCALANVILVLVAILAFIQMRVGDSRD